MQRERYAEAEAEAEREREERRGLACKFFLLWVRHLEGVLLIWFLQQEKSLDGHKVPKLCSLFGAVLREARRTAGGEKEDQAPALASGRKR